MKEKIKAVETSEIKQVFNALYNEQPQHIYRPLYGVWVHFTHIEDFDEACKSGKGKNWIEENTLKYITVNKNIES